MTEISETKPFPAWAYWLLFALLATFSALALFNAAAGSFFRIPQNFNEGWNAYFADAALSGVLYHPHDGMVTNNYPPLSYYLIGGISRLVGDTIFVGRVLSGLGLIAVAVNIYAILRLSRVSAYIALCVAVAFPGFIAIGFHEYVGTNAPQWLAHGVMTSALTLFLIGYQRRGLLVLAAVLMLAAGLIKHNLLPIPLAATVWLFWRERSQLGLWIGTCVIGVAVAAIAIWLRHGAVAFDAILFMERQYRSIPAVGALYQYILPTAPLFFLVIASGVYRQRSAQVVAIYLVIALVWDLYTMSAVGVAQNGIFDYLIALTILTGMALGTLEGRTRLYGVVLVLLPLALVTGQLKKPHRVWEALKRSEIEFRKDEEFLRATDGPVLCHSTALCYWAGKAFEYDPFNTVRKMHLYPDIRSTMIDRMETRYFSVLQIYKLDVYPPDFAAALTRNYELSHTSPTGWKYYLPRRP